MRWPFESLFETRSLPTSARLSQLQHWSDLGIGSGPTKAGVEVSETTAEGLPVVFACVRVLASAVGQLPFKLYRVSPDGKGKTEATDHPLFEVLHDLSTPELSAFELRSLLMSHLLLWGNAFAEIARDTSGQVVALWPLMPWSMGVDRDDRRRLRFRYQTTHGQREWIHDPARPPILRLTINSLDGITGRSVVRVLREAVGLGLAAEQSGATFFGNGATFGGILEGSPSDPERRKELRRQINEQHQGPERAHKFLMLSEGMKYTKLAVDPADAEYLGTRKFTRSELAGAFGVPPHMIGDLERATFSNIEHESIRFLRDGLEPYLTLFESAVRRDCLGPRSFGRYYPRFTRAAMIRGDLASRSTALATQRQNGVINANEWRAFEELDPISDADGGNKYIVNTAAQPLQGGEKTPERESV